MVVAFTVVVVPDPMAEAALLVVAAAVVRPLDVTMVPMAAEAALAAPLALQVLLVPTTLPVLVLPGPAATAAWVATVASAMAAAAVAGATPLAHTAAVAVPAAVVEQVALLLLRAEMLVVDPSPSTP